MEICVAPKKFANGAAAAETMRFEWVNTTGTAVTAPHPQMWTPTNGAGAPITCHCSKCREERK